jgi:very-short-patch-repair endonuclease
MPKAPSLGEETLALHLRANRLEGWEREYRFHATRKWRVDFAWPERKLAVEVEGGTWSGGRHTRGAGFEADLEKYQALTLAGFRLLRFSTAQVVDGRAINVILELLSIIDTEENLECASPSLAAA